MTQHLTLNFDGPDALARAALAELLQRFPQAHFTELDPGRYTVTTDAATAERLAQQPQWRAAMAA
ncbi:MAG: hypothetical protein E6Q67_05995 [Roseateles sp.]|nr:MAG: hypothetical protein E6Q67_05995 [Roseateles sp.]